MSNLPLYFSIQSGADLMQRVRGPGRIVQEEGLAGRVEDELDRLVGQVFALVEAREPATQRPAVTPPRRSAFLRWIEVPVAEAKAAL